MSYWLSKRRIGTRIPLMRGCLHCPYISFGLVRCAACGEMYLVEHEHEKLFSRRTLRKGGPMQLGRFWERGCLKCGHADTSHGCRNWRVDLEEIRNSWWRWALPARLRPNRKKRTYRQRKLEIRELLEKSRSKACDACYNGLFPDPYGIMAADRDLTSG